GARRPHGPTRRRRRRAAGAARLPCRTFRRRSRRSGRNALLESVFAAAALGRVAGRRPGAEDGCRSRRPADTEADTPCRLLSADRPAALLRSAGAAEESPLREQFYPRSDAGSASPPAHFPRSAAAALPAAHDRASVRRAVHGAAKRLRRRRRLLSQSL